MRVTDLDVHRSSQCLAPAFGPGSAWNLSVWSGDTSRDAMIYFAIGAPGRRCEQRGHSADF